MILKIFNEEKELWEKVTTLLAKGIKFQNNFKFFKSDNVEDTLNEIGEKLNDKIDRIEYNYENKVFFFYSGEFLIRELPLELGKFSFDVEEELKWIVGNLKDLKTKDKTTVVAAINEVHSRVDKMEAIVGGESAPEISGINPELIFNTGDVVQVNFFLKSVFSGVHIAKYKIEATEYSANITETGNTSFIIPITRLKKGTNNIQLFVVNPDGFMSNNVNFIINYGSFELESFFNDQVEYEMSDNIVIDFIANFPLDKKVQAYCKMGPREIVLDVINGSNKFEVGNLSRGAHSISIVLFDGEKYSNKLEYLIMVTDASGIFIAFNADKFTFKSGERVTLPIRLSSKLGGRFIINCLLEGEVFKSFVVNSGVTPLDLGYLSEGEYNLSIDGVSEIDTSKESNKLNCNIIILPYVEEPTEPTSRGIVAHFSGKGKSNSENNPFNWENLAGDMTIKAKMNNFNFKNNGNGWEDDGLVINGDAYVEIGYEPFSNNLITGATFDLLFETTNTGDALAKVLQCIEPNSPFKGIEIGLENAKIVSSSGSLVTPVLAGKETRITIVVDRSNGWSFIYVNGVNSSGLRIHNGVSFQQFEKIILGANISNSIPSNFGYSKIKEFMVYNVPLTPDEVLNNFISGFPIETQIEIKKRNDEEKLPCVYMKGNMLGMGANDTPGVDEQKTMSFEFSPKSLPLDPFIIENTKVDHQGSSSLYYEVKNFNVDFFTNEGLEKNVKVMEGWPNHDSYHIKANMIDSSHSYNIGMAKLVHFLHKKELEIDNKVKDFPPVLNGYNVDARTTIDGFPVLMYLWDTNPEKNQTQYRLEGVYTFNLKQHRKVFGLDRTDSEQYLYRAETNENDGAISFKKWGLEDIDILKYPNTGAWEERHQKIEDDTHDQFADLIRWVATSSNEEFVEEINNGNRIHKNKAIDYWLIAYLFGMSDSLGKNLSMVTWGMGANKSDSLWYPCFYDMDTQIGFNNEGVFKFTPDMDYPGTGDKGYNTKESLLWNRMLNLMYNEFKNRYAFLRGTLELDMKMIEKFFVKDIQETVGEKFYNIDMMQKYVPWGEAYLAMAKGNKAVHVIKWMQERMDYVDSILEFNSDNVSKTIDMRFFKPSGEIMEIEIETFTPMYVTVWDDKQVIGKQRCEPDKPGIFKIHGTGALSIIHITCAPNIKSIKGLNGKNRDGFDITMLDISQATRLTELECLDNFSLQQLVTSNCINLRKIDLRGSIKVMPQGRVNTVNLAGCINLTHINISDTNVEELIVTETSELPGCKNLREVNVSDTLLTSLDISNNLYIETINFDNCPRLSILKASGCYNIKELNMENSILSGLYLDECFNLQTLNLNGSKNLINLVLFNNKKLETLNVNGCSKLKELNLSTCNLITNLDIQGCTTIENLNLTGISATSISLLTLRSLKELNFTNTRFISLDLKDCKSTLEKIIASNSLVFNLDLRGFTKLTSLSLTNMPINSLPLDSLDNLKELNISGTDISALNLRTALNLLSVDISNTKIINLNLSFCKKLINFTLSSRDGFNFSLDSLDLSSLENIYSLDFEDGDFTRCANLKNLFVNNCTNLVELKVNENITSVNINNTPLTKTTWSFVPVFPKALTQESNLSSDYSIVFANGKSLSSEEVNQLKSKTLDLIETTSIEIYDGKLAGNKFFLENIVSEIPSEGMMIKAIFKDKELANHVAFLLMKNSVEDSVTQGELDSLFWFGKEFQLLSKSNYHSYLYGKEITTFSGIEYLRNLSYINLSGIIYKGAINLDLKEIISLDYSFADIEGLTGVSFIEGVPKLKSMNSTFKNCKELKVIIIPEAVNLTNADFCFENCISITDIISEKDNSSIESSEGTFKNCLSLRNITLKAGLNKLTNYSNIFENCNIDNCRFIYDSEITKTSQITLLQEVVKSTKSIDFSFLTELSLFDMEGSFDKVEELILSETQIEKLNLAGD